MPENIRENVWGRLGDVWELSVAEDGTTRSRIVAEAGSREAEGFSAKYGDPEHPVDLEPLEGENHA